MPQLYLAQDYNVKYIIIYLLKQLIPFQSSNNIRNNDDIPSDSKESRWHTC